MFWAIMFGGKGRETRRQRRRSGKGVLVARWAHLPLEECTFERQKMRLSDVFSTAWNGSVHWPWNVAQDDQSTAGKTTTLRLTFQTKNEGWRRLVGMQEEEVITRNASQMEEVEPANDGGNMPRFVFEDRGLGYFILRWRTTTWWGHRSAWEMWVDPANVSRGKPQRGFSQQRCDVGYACGKMGREGRRSYAETDTRPASEGRRDYCRPEVNEDNRLRVY